MSTKKIIALASMFALVIAQTCYDDAPFDCPEGTYCSSWNDGCNSCGCGGPDSIPLCTLAFCDCYFDNSCVPSCSDNDQCTPIGLGRDNNNTIENNSTLNGGSNKTCYDDAPFDCPEGTYCSSWNDGCNACDCEGPDSIPLCTTAFCDCYSDNSCVPSCSDNDQCTPIGLGGDNNNTTENNSTLNGGSISTVRLDTLTSSPVSILPVRGEMLRVEYQFGFFDGALPPGVTAGSLSRDIPSLICKTQTFFTQLLETATGSSSLYTPLKGIDWEVLSSGEYPVLVEFTVEFYDELDGGQQELSATYASLLYQELKNLSSSEWLWLWTDLGDTKFFSSTNSFASDYLLIANPVQGQLARVDCDDGIRA